MTAAAKVHDSSSAGNGRSPDAKGQPAAPPADAPHPWRLVTISCSHYCDKARWALDMAGHPYEEDMYPPFIHLGGTLLGGLKKRTTPQLVSPDKQQVIADSTDILRWAARTYPDTPAGRLYPKGLEEQVHRWEDKFNRGLGPQSRVVAYYHLFKSPGAKAVVPLVNCPDMPPWRAWAFKTFYPVITSLMRVPMKIYADNTRVCTEKIRGVFAEVSEALSDGRPFLVPGSTAPTAADVTFAALAYPMLAPANVGGKLQIKVPTPTTPDWPGTELAVTRAGQHAFKMYDRYRLPPFDGATRSSP